MDDLVDQSDLSKGARTMTGEIIHFQSHRDYKRGQLYREQTVPRRASATRRSKDPSRSPHPANFVPEARTPQALELQVARIAHLVEELEELGCTFGASPPAILTLARAGMEGARRILRTSSLSEPGAHLADDGDGEPQPEIDREMLDRMYRDLNSDA